MAVKISDLIPKKVPVPTGAGDLEVGALSLEAIASVIANHRDAVLHLVASAQATGMPNFGRILEQFPDLCADVLAFACEAQGQQEDIKKLPAAVQLIALGEAWNLSVPDPKKLGQYVSTVMGQLQKRSPASVPTASADSTLTNSSETSPETSAS